MDHALFKKTVNWLGVIILLHLAAMLLFGLFMASSVESIAKDAPGEAYSAVLVYDIVIYTAFALLYRKLETSYSDYRRNIKNALKGHDFSWSKYYKENFLKIDLIRYCVLVAIQLPFALFYQILGLSLTAITPVERFYIIDAGAYGITGSSILGFLLNSVLLAVIYFAVNIITFVVTWFLEKAELASFEHNSEQ